MAKKVKITSLILILILLAMTTLFVACGDEKPDEKPDETLDDVEIDTSAYGQLTDAEKEVFDVLITKFKLFKNPSSVRILAANYKPTLNRCDLKLQATNSFGGTISENYILYYDTYTDADSENTTWKGYFEKMDFFNVWDSGDLSIPNLNKAIVEYWEKQGF